MFTPIAEFVITKGTPTKEAKEKLETNPITVEAKINKCSVQFKVLQTFL